MALSRGLRCCARVFSWIPVLIITSVVLWSYYAYVFELCVFTISNTLEKVAYLLVFHVCFVMFSWTYWKAIFTPPATPCKKVGVHCWWFVPSGVGLHGQARHHQDLSCSHCKL
ncbi:unnamed protein product [Oncorhynchus mykiss]|uniref:Uncharacterized protein n=1 Tax=Oncorhynchus mykiss TaxID=8022 RepID=A0A060Z129_ONCMY|nr:unnamed protein product [Oncorhynchus mykiss]